MASTRYEREATLRASEDAVRCVVALPDGRVVGGGSRDGDLEVWHRKLGRVMTLTGHEGTVRCALLTRAGVLVSGADDCTIKCWDLANGSCLQTLSGHAHGIELLAELSGDRLVSGTDGGGGTESALKVWGLRSGQCLRSLEQSIGLVCVMPLSDGRRIISCGFDLLLKVWDANDGSCLERLELSSEIIHCLAQLPDGRVISGGVQEEEGSFPVRIKIWDFEGLHSRRLGDLGSRCRCVAILPDGHAIFGLGSGTLEIWDLASPIHPARRVQSLIVGHGRTVYSVCVAVAVLPDGRLASGSTDGTLTIYADTTRETEKQLARQVGRQRACVDVVNVITRYL